MRTDRKHASDLPRAHGPRFAALDIAHRMRTGGACKRPILAGRAHKSSPRGARKASPWPCALAASAICPTPGMGPKTPFSVNLMGRGRGPSPACPARAGPRAGRRARRAVSLRARSGGPARAGSAGYGILHGFRASCFMVCPAWPGRGRRDAHAQQRSRSRREIRCPASPGRSSLSSRTSPARYRTERARSPEKTRIEPA